MFAQLMCLVCDSYLVCILFIIRVLSKI